MLADQHTNTQTLLDRRTDRRAYHKIYFASIPGME